MLLITKKGAIGTLFNLNDPDSIYFANKYNTTLNTTNVEWFLNFHNETNNRYSSLYELEIRTGSRVFDDLNKYRIEFTMTYKTMICE